jgi:hypothetical protein
VQPTELAEKNHNNVFTNKQVIERFHVTSSPPCWCPMNKRFLISVHC